MLLSNVKGESDTIEREGGSRLTLPPVEQLGAITKWMSDPPPKDPNVKPLIDDYYASLYSYNYSVGGRETLRLYDEYNDYGALIGKRATPFSYQPNIDFLSSQNCFALNYQWPSQITLPSMIISLSPDSNVDIQQLRASAPSGCFVVLVGARYLNKMHKIIRMVEYITSQLAIKLVTYFAEKSDVMPVVDLDNSPAIVGDFSYKTYSDAFIYC